MPVYVRETCKHPSVNEVDARSIIARYAEALKACNAKRRDGVLFYDDVVKGFAGR